MKLILTLYVALVLSLLQSGLYAADSRMTLITSDFSKMEEFERYPGGAATHTMPFDKRTYSHPSTNMSGKRKLDFTLGRAMFKRLWVSAPTATQAADGLGPLFNARSCLLCHKRNGRGRPHNEEGKSDPSLFLRLSISVQTHQLKSQLKTGDVRYMPEPTYGGQLQKFAVRGVKAEGQVRIDYEMFTVELSDGESVVLRKPDYSITDLGYGPMDPAVMVSPRMAPQMIGLGLLGAITDADLEELADPNDWDGDGISGRLNRVWSLKNNGTMIGRFGWKAGTATVDEQTQGAFAGDIGISVPLFRDGAGECTKYQVACQNAPHGNSPQYENLEAHSGVTNWTALYTRNLAVPQRRDPDATQVLQGKKLFYESGCVACHKPKFVTAKNSVDPEHAGQLIWPYTDLLLHDMGEGLADHRPEGQASGREWRTAPLWGIGLSETVNGNGYYLHDGRARTIMEAILWHGGEAQDARDRVVDMSRSERTDLIRFVKSL